MNQCTKCNKIYSEEESIQNYIKNKCKTMKCSCGSTSFISYTLTKVSE